MKKLVLIGILILIFFATTNISQAKINDDPPMHCVYAYCFGTVCGPEFADMTYTLQYLDLAYQYCTNGGGDNGAETEIED